MCVSFVRPLLEYCDSVWDNATTESKKQLDAFHIEAARIITGATKLCSISLLLSDLGWESLQDRRNKHKLIFFYKIIHGLTPTYLTDILPPLIQETTDYNLRNAIDFRTLHANTKDLGQSPIQSAQVLTACYLDNAYLTTMFLCLNKTVTFSVPTKIKIF